MANTKGKPNCCSCKPCESEVNPCFVMTLNDGIYVRHATGPEPTFELSEEVIEYDPEDLPRGGEMLCVWNETSGKYECRAWVLSDMESVEENFTIADRYDGDERFRSVPRPEVTGRYGFYGNLCGGARDYGGWALPDAFDYSDGTGSYTHECENPIPASDCDPGSLAPDLCNFGITSSAGEPHCNAHFGPLRLRWYREGTGGGSGPGILPPAYIEGINSATGNLVILLDGGVTALGAWWAIVPWIVAPGSPPAYWWPIATPITLQWTPGEPGTTVAAPGASISDGGIYEHQFQPMPDITLTSECESQAGCGDIDPVWPACLHDFQCNMRPINFHLEYDDGITESIEGTFEWNGAPGYLSSGTSPVMIIQQSGEGVGDDITLYVDDIGYGNVISEHVLDLACTSGQINYSHVFTIFVGEVEVHITLTLWTD
jgi:hypothetical protein